MNPLPSAASAWSARSVPSLPFRSLPTTSVLSSSSSLSSGHDTYSNEYHAAVEADTFQGDAPTHTRIKALAASWQHEMEREAALIGSQNQQLEESYLTEVRRKYATKKKLMLLSLREAREEETQHRIAEATAHYEQVQREELEQLEAALLEDCENELRDLHMRHEHDLDVMLTQVRTQRQRETMERKQALTQQLEEEHEAQLQAIEEQSRVELSQWEEKKRLALERKMLQRREEIGRAHV